MTKLSLTCHLLEIITLSILVGVTSAIDNATYWKEREDMLLQEDMAILGHFLMLTPEEKAANDILMGLKMAEMDAAFLDLNFLPSKSFLVSRKEIEASPVFQILKLMPKGSALHIHDASTVSVEWIISELTYWDNLYMCYDQEGKLLAKFMSTPDTSCEWQLVSEARASYPSPEDFDKELLGKLSLVTDNPEEKYPDINSVWEAFNDNVVALDGFERYRPAWEAYFSRLLTEFMEDNVQYLEVKSELGPLYELDGSEYPIEEVTEIYKQISLDFVDLHGGDFFGNRIIHAHGIRDEEAVWAAVNTTKALKQMYPDFIAGFDIVGQEDMRSPYKIAIDPLLTLASGEDAMPTFYHAGETNWMGMDPDENLIDAILLNASRIGHGYAITKHPQVMQMAREKDIPLEVCPVSNQVLMLVEDLRNHPAASLVASNFPIVISSDDATVFGSRGLSYDFYMAFMALGGAKADLRFLKKLAMNSIQYSTLDDVQRNDLMALWYEKWYEFIATVNRMDSKNSKPIVAKIR